MRELFSHYFHTTNLNPLFGYRENYREKKNKTSRKRREREREMEYTEEDEGQYWTGHDGGNGGF